MKEPQVMKPKEPGTNPETTELEKAVWTEQVKTYWKRTDELPSSLADTHAVIRTNAVRSRTPRCDRQRSARPEGPMLMTVFGC
jgi:hypothetical protein